jgi:hypothetical protein
MEEENILSSFNDDYSLFIEAGFVAVKQLDEIAGRRLFKAAEILNPDNPASKLGIGYIALNKLQVTEASTIFESILNEDPSHHLAKALLGVSYLLTKDKKKKGEELILEAKAKSDDPTIKNLADTCLDWVGKDLLLQTRPPAG